MKSNYLKSVAPVAVEPEAGDENDENKVVAVAEHVQTDEEKEVERKERIASAMHRARHAAVSFIGLSCETVFEIN